MGKTRYIVEVARDHGASLPTVRRAFITTDKGIAIAAWEATTSPARTSCSAPSGTHPAASGAPPRP